MSAYGYGFGAPAFTVPTYQAPMMYAQPTIQYMPQPHIETYQNKEKCPTRANANKLAGMHDKGSIAAKRSIWKRSSEGAQPSPAYTAPEQGRVRKDEKGRSRKWRIQNPLSQTCKPLTNLFLQFWHAA